MKSNLRVLAVATIFALACGASTEADAGCGLFAKLKCKLRCKTTCCEVETTCGCESDCGCGSEIATEGTVIIESAEPTEVSPADTMPAVPEPPAEEGAVEAPAEPAVDVVEEAPGA